MTAYQEVSSFVPSSLPKLTSWGFRTVWHGFMVPYGHKKCLARLHGHSLSSEFLLGAAPLTGSTSC